MNDKHLHKAIKKAGILLYGWVREQDGTQKLHVLTPYTEGRFGPFDKAYAIPQGSVDLGERPVDAAIRETREETGIDLRKLMGLSAHQQFTNGLLVGRTPTPADGYEGVSVISADPQALRHSFVSGHGAMQDTAYYAVEVAGIEKLAPHLKRMSLSESPEQHIVHTTAEDHAKSQGMPTFEQMIGMLYSGIVPRNGNIRDFNSRRPKWAGEKPLRIIKKPVLPALLNRGRTNTFVQSLEDIQTVESFTDLCQAITGSEFKDLSADLDALKNHLQACKVIGDEGGLLKLDTKDRPLSFFQEAAEILPIGEVIKRSSAAALMNQRYANAMWGDYKGPRKQSINPHAYDKTSITDPKMADERNRMLHAQIAPFVQLASLLSPSSLGEFQSPDPQAPKGAAKQVSGTITYGQRVNESYGKSGYEAFTHIERLRHRVRRESLDQKPPERG